MTLSHFFTSSQRPILATIGGAILAQEIGKNLIKVENEIVKHLSKHLGADEKTTKIALAALIFLSNSTSSYLLLSKTPGGSLAATTVFFSTLPLIDSTFTDLLNQKNVAINDSLNLIKASKTTYEKAALSTIFAGVTLFVMGQMGKKNLLPLMPIAQIFSWSMILLLEELQEKKMNAEEP